MTDAETNGGEQARLKNKNIAITLSSVLTLIAAGATIWRSCSWNFNPCGIHWKRIQTNVSWWLYV